MDKKIIKHTGLPFWSWNDKLDKNKLISQIRKMKENGYGGFFMHARSGLTTEYLGEEWFDCVRACCDEAKKLGMQAWAYDENGWPSGFVGGKLLETKEFRLHYLNFSKGKFDKKATFNYLIDGEILKLSDTNENGEYINVFDCESVSLADILNPVVVDAFISETHEKYKKEIKNLNDNISGFFTDEPLYCEQEFYPYSRVLKDYYFKRYGEDLFDNLGLLFFKGKGYEKFRYRYYKSCQELFLKNFSEKVYNWLDDNGLKLTGHYVEERDFYSQILNNAGIMPYYEFMHMPGIDWLCRRYLTVSTIRQLTSVTAQLNKKYALSEMFAMTGWDVTPKELKNIADYQYNYGINIMCQHLLPYSERGQRKNDYPAHFSSFNSWVDKGMFDFNNYFDALGQFIRDGVEEVNVGVLFTVRSAYIGYDPAVWTCVEDLEESYIVFGCEHLANNHVAFHILDETLLGKYGGVSNGKITLGACSYHTLVIPKSIVIDKSTDIILRKFVSEGGKILLLDGTPRLVDGDPSDFSYLKSNISFEEICKENSYFISSDSKFLHTSLRTVNGKKFVFAVNIGNEDIITKIICDGTPFNALYDVITDEIKYVGDVITIPAKESVIACINEIGIPKPVEYETVGIGDCDYSVVDYNANYYSLDFARMSYDGMNYGDVLPVVGIFRNLLSERYSGNVYLKYNFVVKEIPENISVIAEDVEKISATLNGFPLKFDGTSDLDEIYRSAFIADKISLGQNELIFKYDFYQSENVYFALFGEGVSESIKNCMTYDTMISSPFLSGKFGVYSDNFKKGRSDNYVSADSFYIKNAPDKTGELVTSGFPFFAGNITLKRTFFINSKKVKLKLNGRFHIAEIKINGKSAGKLMFTNIIDVSKFVVKGENLLEIKLYSGNRNLLGPHHLADRDSDTEVGPYAFDFTDTWENNGASNFTSSYSFSKFGLFDK